MSDGGTKARPPHPATVGQPSGARPPHPATLPRVGSAQPEHPEVPRPAHPATVAQKRETPFGASRVLPPHPATVMQPRGTPFGAPRVHPPHPATVVQPREAPFRAPKVLPPHPATMQPREVTTAAVQRAAKDGKNQKSAPAKDGKDDKQTGLKLTRIPWGTGNGAQVAEARGGTLKGSAQKGRNLASICMSGPIAALHNKIFTASSVPAGKGVAHPMHSERAVWALVETVMEDVPLQKMGQVKIQWLYTEREPCGVRPGHQNCTAFLTKLLKQYGASGLATPIYYSFDYPDNRVIADLLAYYNGELKLNLAKDDVEGLAELALKETAQEFDIKYNSKYLLP